MIGSGTVRLAGLGARLTPDEIDHDPVGRRGPVDRPRHSRPAAPRDTDESLGSLECKTQPRSTNRRPGSGYLTFRPVLAATELPRAHQPRKEPSAATARSLECTTTPALIVLV